MIVISFHAYKGGSCCSTTVLNTLPFLVQELQADKSQPILVVDFDLDSAGLTYLLEADQYFEKVYDAKTMLSGSLPGKNNRDTIEDHPLFTKCLPVGDKLGVEKEAVYFLGIDDEKTFDTADMVGSSDRTIYELRRLCRQLNFKAIIFDNAAGDTFSAVLANRLSDVIVCCMRPTKQSRMGTEDYLDRIEGMMIDEVTGEQLRHMIILPTAVPQTDLLIKGKDPFEDAIKLIRETIKEFSYEINRDFLTYEQFGIPEVERFKWQEDVLYRLNGEAKNQEDCLLALDRYHTLAKSIVKEGKHEQ